jgi:hypothetical protein
VNVVGAALVVVCALLRDVVDDDDDEGAWWCAPSGRAMAQAASARMAMALRIIFVVVMGVC